MKLCKFCQAELADNGTVCPSCGKDNAEEEILTEETVAEAATEETAAEETVTEEIASEETVSEKTASDETADEEIATEASPVEKKATPGKIALAVAAVVVLAAVLIGLIAAGLGSGKTEDAAVPSESAAAEAATETEPPATVPADGNPEDVTCKGTYTVSDEEAVATKDAVVATVGEHQLSNAMLRIYYRNALSSFLNSEYGYYLMMYGILDYTKPLDTQISMEDQNLTWQQYFLDVAVRNWQLTLAMAEESGKAGLEMFPEDKTALDSLGDSLDEAAAYYSVTKEELLKNDFGAGVDMEDLIAFQELYYRGNPYYQAEMERLVPTEADLEEYFTAHAEDYAANNVTKDTKYVNVRHILVIPKDGTTDENGITTYTDEAWAQCEADAQAILQQYLDGDRTEESFAALANEKSEDPGSNTNGGLYEDVYEGQMVKPFEEWSFDESRAAGDTGVVKTDYGYHVMYYVSSELAWTSYAESGWKSEAANRMIENILEMYPVEVTYGNITLGNVKMA